jgi:hypothetical protein
MIKKILQTTIACCMAFSLAACGEDAPEYAGAWFFPKGSLLIEPVEDDGYPVTFYSKWGKEQGDAIGTLGDENALMVDIEGRNLAFEMNEDDQLTVEIDGEEHRLLRLPEGATARWTIQQDLYKQYIDDPEGWQAFRKEKAQS